MLKFITKKLKNNKGFTLIELVVVIAILGILAAIAVPKLSNTTQKAATAAHNANVRTLESAATMFIAEKGFPNGTITWDGTDGDANEEWKDYLQEWPTIPDGISDDVSIYTVTISDDGTIEVNPAKDLEAETDEAGEPED